MSITHGLPPMRQAERGRDERGETPRPPLDRVVAVVEDALPPNPVTAEQLPTMRAGLADSAEAALDGLDGLTHTEATVPTADGAEVTLSVFRIGAGVGPAIMWIHGGGMITGNRFSGVRPYLEQILKHGGTLVTPEYRLAPENPAPIPVEDCYAAYAWAFEHAADLGFDPQRFILAGSSAGGCLAAGVALLARDRKAPQAAGVLLECPMLDDRNDSTSIRQYDVASGWCAQSNEFGWTALLGAARGTDDVSPYDAPARATWLGGLPPIHISVGSADPFRDEDVDFATGIWRDGGDCELHVLPGGVHGFEAYAPTGSLTAAVLRSRDQWIDRILNPDDPDLAYDGLPALVRLLTGKDVDAEGGRQFLESLRKSR